jgi:coproporphyrinogen III oxidase
MQALDEAAIRRPHLVRKPAHRICAEFEAIEREAGSDAASTISLGPRGPSGEPGGGGVRGLMKGKVFEKVGVNVSTVGGTFTRVRQVDPGRGGTATASSPPASAWSRTWPTRTCRPCT